VKEFAEAGYGKDQQIAALANAIAESSLNANAEALGEGSFGLFQCRRFKGVGGNHSIPELKDPTFNTRLIIAEAKKVPTFGNAPNVDAAVAAFVIGVERPQSPDEQITKRQGIARALVT
jgi:hypothetical protein